jgi:hypothetical protein
MQENKSIVEEALIQMKNVEQAIAENAKGILRSTMKEEIGQLVKESLSEQDDEEEVDLDSEIDTDVEVSPEEDEMEMDVDNEEGMDMDIDMDMDMDSESPIDLTGASDEEILKIFKAMGEEDGIIVKKDGDDIHITDNNQDAEYLVKLGESLEEDMDMASFDETLDEEGNPMDMGSDETSDMDDEKIDMIVSKLFDGDHSLEEEEDDEEEEEDDEEEVDEIVYEISLDEDDDIEEMEEGAEVDELDEQDDIDPEMAMEMEEGMDSDMEEEMHEDMEEDMDGLEESYDHKKVGVKEAKMTVKPVGKGIGKPNFKYDGETEYKSPKKMKQGTKGVGMGKPKFEYKEGENTDGKTKVVKAKKKVEAKEAARTYGFGSKDGSRGLRKAITDNRNLTFEALEIEVKQLREKNEEYRKALNIFRSKLNEVAIFNSNLAYATRLFTEHATTKKEKINILRRFDSVESLKESKNLYKTLKDELSNTDSAPSKSINESVGKIEKVVSTGSATNLIENKTYEAPQFLRIKDLMSKIG